MESIQNNLLHSNQFLGWGLRICSLRSLLSQSVSECQLSQVSGVWKIKGLKRQIPSEFLAESQAYLRVRLARKGKKDRQHFSFVLRPVQCVWRRASRVVEEGKTNLTLRVIDWQEKKPDTNQWSTSVRSKEANVQNWTLELSVFPTFFSFRSLSTFTFWHQNFQDFQHNKWDFWIDCQTLCCLAKIQISWHGDLGISGGFCNNC